MGSAKSLVVVDVDFERGMIVMTHSKSHITKLQLGLVGL